MHRQENIIDIVSVIIPCITFEFGRMIYVYPEKDLRIHSGTIRESEEWDNTYKIRIAVERDINHIKENLCFADKIKHHEYIRRLKPLIA